MKKIIKQNLRFYSKLFLFIGALIAFICSFGVSSYAWHTDTQGNLVSDNLQKINDKSNTVISGVAWSIKDSELILNGTSTSGNWTNISTNIFTLPSGTYTLYWWTNYQYNNIGFGARSIETGYTELYQLNSQRYRTFTLTRETAFTIVVWWGNSNLVFNNVSVKTAIYNGTYDSSKTFEPYGAKYYGDNTISKIANASLGAFKFCDSIELSYNTTTNNYVYKTYSNIYELLTENFITSNNNGLRINDNTLLVTLGGDSNWDYTFKFHFPSSTVKIEYFNEWAFIGAYLSYTFKDYNNVTYSYTPSGPAPNLVLTEHNFLSSSYLSDITFSRDNPNIAVAFSGLSTPSATSSDYINGYDNGYTNGYEIAYEKGIEEGKNEYYPMGYSDGYREGSYDEFTTSGFRTLIGSIFNYPINFLRTVFNFEFMGINVSGLIFFIVSLGIVIFVVKKLKE